MTEVKDIDGKRLVLKKGDITLEDADAIVNAANSSLTGGGGVDGAIHRAGGTAILEECKRIIADMGRLPTGEAVITTAGRMKAKHVIHTVGPIWSGGERGEAKLLADCYRHSLELAAGRGLRSVAFPSISTGAYRYPVEEAAGVALSTIIETMKNHDIEEVRVVLFSDRDYEIYRSALKDLEEGRWKSK